MAESDPPKPAHPLEEADAKDCYEIMMRERSTLIAAKRESEDTLVKSVVQLSVALTAIITGFVTTKDVINSIFQAAIFCLIMVSMVLSLTFGLMEHWMSSIAYGEQIKKVQEFYTRKSSDFLPPKSSSRVRLFQTLCLSTFIGGVLLLAILANIKVWEKIDDPTSSPLSATNPTSPTT